MQIMLFIFFVVSWTLVVITRKNSLSPPTFYLLAFFFIGINAAWVMNILDYFLVVRDDSATGKMFSSVRLDIGKC
jgi:hypothetical protein